MPAAKIAAGAAGAPMSAVLAGLASHRASQAPASRMAQAQAAAQEWQDAYVGAVEGKAFYEQLFSERCEQGAI